MTSLGTLRGGTSSRATGINDLGQVVGSSGVNEYGPQFREFQQGFVWQNGTMRALGSLFCPCKFNQRYGTSAASAINASGQVVGDSGTARGGKVRHAFLWHSRVMQDLEEEPGSRATSQAYGINASGQVVGVLEGRATLWQGGVARDLGTLPGDASSTARAINAAGHVVGESLAGPKKSRAVLWQLTARPGTSGRFRVTPPARPMASMPSVRWSAGHDPRIINRCPEPFSGRAMSSPISIACCRKVPGGS